MQMLTKNSTPYIITLVTLSSFLSGCGLSVKAMVPDTASLTQKRINKTITIMDVTGGKKPVFGGPEMVTNELFKKALVAAVEQSGIFKTVTDKGGDLALYASIKTHDQQLPKGLEYRARLIVQYKVLRSVDNYMIWTETYESAFSSVAFSGATRTTRAREGSVRVNLASFIEGISKRLPE